MSEPIRNQWVNILDKTALDWIPIIFNLAEFDKYPRPTDDRQQEIQSQVAHLSGEPLNEVVVHFEKLLEQDDARRTSIEAKAFSLIGIAGIAIGFVIGFAQFFVNNTSLLSESNLRVGIISVYALVGASLLITLVISREVVVVEKYRFMSPIPSDLLKLTNKNRDFIYRQYAADLLLSYEHNMALINDKATYLRGAQDWFRNAIVLVFVLLLSFTIYLSFEPNTEIQDDPILVIIVTPTLTPTNTPTSTVTPTNTPTPSPTFTPSSTPTP